MSTANITGNVHYRTRETLPDITLVIELRDISLADAPAALVASCSRQVPAQGPLSYTLEYDPRAIQPGHEYSVSAALYQAGSLYKYSDTHHLVELPATQALDILVNSVGLQRPQPEPGPGKPAVEGIHGGNLFGHPAIGFQDGNLFTKP